MKRLTYTLLLAALLGLSAAWSVEAQGPFSAQIVRALRAYGFSTPGVLNGLADGTVAAPSIAFASQPDMGWYRSGVNSISYAVGGTPYTTLNGNLVLTNAGSIGWSSTGLSTGTVDTSLFRDGAADTLAQRRGTNPQTLRVYNTFTDASNYERGELVWSGNAFIIRTAMLGTGVARTLQFAVGGTNIWGLNTSGHMVWNADNTYDMGAVGATRPRNVFVGNNISVAGSASIGSALYTSVLFSSLGASTNGTVTYCSDCTVTTAATCPATQASCVCAGSGSGAFARRVNGAWYCTF